MIDTRPARTPRLLLIEDDPVSRRLVSRLMEQQKRLLRTAASGPVALELCRREHFDLILMDLYMPEMDGYTTRQRILSVYAGNAIPPMICVTADTRAETRARLQREGFCECLYKPLDLARLTASLDRHLPIAPPMMREQAPDNIPAQLRTELYTMLVNSLPGEYRRLCLARDRCDRDSLLHIAHTLAGNAAICGVSTLSHAAMKLEQSLQSDPPKQDPASLELLLRLIAPLLKQSGPTA